MVRRIACLAWVLAALDATNVHAAPPRRSTVTAGGVRLAGEAHVSSVGMRREPEYVLTNLTGDPRVVELVELAALGGGGRRHPLAIRGARRIVLAPHATRSVTVGFAGQPVEAGGGLPYHRFSLTVAVGALRLASVASNAYMCRIPARHTEVP